MDYENEKPRRLPLSEHALTTFQENGRLDYGTLIEWEEFEKCIGIEKSEDWKFRGVFLEFCKKLRPLGFKHTEHGTDGKGFRILTREEMAPAVHDEMLRQANRNLESSIMLSNVPRHGLSEKQQKQLDMESVRSAYMGGIMKRVSLMRKLPATPEMARKAVHGALLKSTTEEEDD